ncbi:MAG: hypothetical protein FVQ77_10735 [Cytophagales bacterium]|nr:hypothetical protein [Cytophagales bacterium]
MTAKVLQNGKYIVTKGVVFYQAAGGLLVTHFTSPSEYLVSTNARGEYKIYNKEANTITQSQGADYSSENSFLYYFLSGKTQSMGLRSVGFQLIDTKIEDNLVITTWSPPLNLSSLLSKAELAHENYQPIFLGFFDSDGKPKQKVFYTAYSKIGNYNIPLNITEFQYLTQGDSIITKRSYSDVKINEQVDDTYLSFKIPVNAKLIKQGY